MLLSLVIVAIVVQFTNNYSTQAVIENQCAPSGEIKPLMATPVPNDGGFGENKVGNKYNIL